MDEQLYYTVKFHFPYARVTLEKVTADGVDTWRWWLLRNENKPFHVVDEHREYVINPAMVTYMEITEYHPF